MGFDISGISAAASAISALDGIATVMPNERGYYAQKEDKSLDNTAMLFHIEDENTATLQSDVTDHAVEDNTIRNDQISIKPEIVTVRGYIGELNNVLPNELTVAREAQEKLISISGYEPEFTTETLRALNQAEQAYFTSQNAKKLKTSLIDKDATNQTKQQEVFQRFFSYWKKKTLFTVITPWGKFSDMSIQVVKATQGDTETMSDFSITFKKVRFASTTFTPDVAKYGRLVNQSAQVTNNGLRAGEETTRTVTELVG